MIKTNSLLVTKYILKILESSEEVRKFFNDKIFPLEADFGSKYPFCAILRTGMRPASAKDGLYEDNVYFSVVVVSDTYGSAIDGANLIRNNLDRTYYIDSEISIRSILLENATETWQDNKFFQELMFVANVQFPQR